MMMGVPLIILYEISVLAVWLFGRRSFRDFQDGGQEE
jgi:Sec-independent protein secretion pathway component TatC